MSQLDGQYDCITKSPMGDQKSVFTVKTDGSSFTGDTHGNTLNWKMQMKVPMPMTLTCTATIDGDTLTGTVNAGAFGSMAMTGTRKA